MEKIQKISSPDGDLHIYTDDYGCLILIDELNENESMLSLSEALSYLDLWGQDTSRIENLDNFNLTEQEFVDIVGKQSRDIETFCEYAYKLGINPLPSVRKMLGGKIPVHYSQSGDYQALSKDMAGMPYLMVVHNPDTGKVYASIRTYWLDDVPADNGEQDSEDLFPEIATEK